MGLAQGALAGTGDNPLPFIVGGVVVVALIVLVAAFVLMRRK
ncbi:LPXTG cell wall anchor domain-containing protein [Gordonibacter sp. An230]|nr:LPXTG cell wall anchor domain-containing protein [Gordonibacter sp. An230]